MAPQVFKAGIAFGLALAILAAGPVQRGQAKIVTFDPPSSTWTMPTAINASGWITGFYLDGNAGLANSFLRAPDGMIETIDVPGAACGAYAWSINRGGVVVGTGQDNNCKSHAFTKTADGTITTFDVPGAIDTNAFSINNKGMIAGSFRDTDDRTHGFMRAADGTFTIFDAPDAIFTSPASINKAGAITGNFEDNHQVWHGFVRLKDGTLTAFDPPASTFTHANSINDAGEIVGSYKAGEVTTFGFIRYADGEIKNVDPEDSSYVIAYGINNDGTVTGLYQTDISHGFFQRADGTIKPFDVKGAHGGTSPLAINGRGAIIGVYGKSGEDSAHGFLRTH